MKELEKEIENILFWTKEDDDKNSIKRKEGKNIFCTPTQLGEEAFHKK